MLLTDARAHRVTIHKLCVCLADRTAEVASKGANDTPTSLYLGNLQWWTTDAELESLCAEYGPVNSLKIIDDRQNGKSKGYALVEFPTAASAKACKEGLHGCGLQLQ